MSPFLVSPGKPPIPFPVPLLTNPPTSKPWHSPILGNRAFTGPKASPPTDARQCYPLLHKRLEPWVPLCVFFGWWFSPWELWRYWLVHTVCSFYGAENPFNSLGLFSSSFIGDSVLIPMDDCEHPLLYLSGTGRASQETAISGSFELISVLLTLLLLWSNTVAKATYVRV